MKILNYSPSHIILECLCVYLVIYILGEIPVQMSLLANCPRINALHSIYIDTRRLQDFQLVIYSRWDVLLNTKLMEKVGQ